jgi:AraC-like DNA-binding protein
VSQAPPHPSEWVRYWRSADERLEAMHARFQGHAYHRHSHETYSFGVTESGAQTFTCRGTMRTSAAGMVMAFNPDDPHDGHATARDGFVYRMVHVAPTLVQEVLAGTGAGPPRLPLFADPVADDAGLAAGLRRLHAGLAAGTDLERDDLLAAGVLALVERLGSAATRSLAAEPPATAATAELAQRVRALLDEAHPGAVVPDELAAATGCSRYTLYRAFRSAFGLSPGDYQRQLRLRAARRLLASGRGPAEVAAEVGFADQAHLTRWFVRTFGVTPGAYRLGATAGLA